MRIRRRYTYLALVCVASGCALDPSPAKDKRAASSSEPLLTGTATSARPEIGQFVRGSAWCTATLIAPKYVLTAGHCLFNADEHDITSPVVMPGDHFTFTDLSGTTRNVNVTNLYTFGRNSRDETPDHGLTDDVMLVQLASEVPPSQAVPATMARVYPSDDAPATIFGYGCQDRSTLAGAGVKRYFTFPYGPHNSNQECDGDSGGPVVFGNLGDDGPIFAGSTGHAGTIFGLYDVFNDVAWAKGKIEALIRRWEYYGILEYGMDRPGMDYKVVTIPDNAPIDCYNQCASAAENDTCKAFSFVSANPIAGIQAQCFLKYAVPETVSRPGIVSGMNRVRASWKETDVDRPGYDYRDFDDAGWGPETCSRECAKDDRCRAFTWTPTNGGAKAHCWLKNAVPGPIVAALSGTVSAARGGLEMEVNRPGMDFDDFDINFPEQCQSRCANDSTCQAWTFTNPTPTASGHCWLKNAIPGGTYYEGMVSGLSGNEFF